MASDFWAFFKPTPVKTGAMLAVGASLLWYAASSDAPPRFSFLIGLAVTSNAFFYGAYLALSKLQHHLPDFLRPAMAAPAA